MRETGGNIEPSSGFLQRNKKEITKRASERTRSQQPPKKVVQSADSKTIHARKQKEQHAIEQAKLDAIEAKIQKARQRIDEVKAQKSIKAQNSNLNAKVTADRGDDMLFDEQLGLVQQTSAPTKPHVPLIGGRQKGSVASSLNANDRGSNLQLKSSANMIL